MNTTNSAKLAAMLDQYRRDERPMPTYAELQALCCGPASKPEADIRSAALEEAIAKCEKRLHREFPKTINAVQSCIDAIRALSSAPAPAAGVQVAPDGLKPFLWIDPSLDSKWREEDTLMGDVKQVTITGATRQWGDFTMPLFSSAPAALSESAPSEAKSHDDRLAIIRDSGDQALIDSVQCGKISIAAAVAKVAQQAGGASGSPPEPALRDGATANGWIAVGDQFPAGRCLASFKAQNGKRRTIVATYVHRFTVEAQGDDCYSEVNEANDTDYLMPGWYECIENWGDFSSVFVNEGEVTHWMPLPAEPGALGAVPVPRMGGNTSEESSGERRAIEAGSVGDDERFKELLKRVCGSYAMLDVQGIEIGELVKYLDYWAARKCAPGGPDIDAMVNRFLGWRLPKTFFPDCGITFDGRKDDEWNKNKTWPIGTNLLTAVEAKAMFEHVLAGQSGKDGEPA